MKVGVELQPFLKTKTGIGVYTYELVKRLQDVEGIELHGNIFNFMNRNDLKETLQGITFSTHTCAIFPYGIYSRLWDRLPISYNALFREKVELYHFFNFLVPEKIKGKVITTIHDLTFLLYPETMEEANLKRLKKNLAYAIERADKVITISQSSKRGLIEYLKVPEGKIEIIYPGVDSEEFSKEYSSKEKQRVKEKYHLPEEYILYMGTLEPRKNIETIVSAFHRFKAHYRQETKKIKLVIAGKKGWQYESIFKRVEILDLVEEIVFTDYVAEQDKAILYQLARVFVFPSLYEGFGMPILEAMAAGVPVITSSVSSMPEAAGEAALLVEPKDVIGIAEGMATLLWDEVIRLEKIEKGKSQVNMFTWEASCEKLYRVYKNMQKQS